ncbi:MULTISPECIES: hypothetical protein [Nocardiopsis]|uniref:Uncharacterized protein n=1 Tax=Nocardiopsis changdeensis TaxID=2831969 RepID=A0ABX8BVU1_9ACTN|nr:MULTISPECIES: hypothetical protein [Nocardiopsis]QUX26360.1 hypothetical protein KGD84_32180 [Nocardiopsis changdeensis]QYX40820.1 hypothetical protein K1J57_32995 [Nocardiopsis sp. MT53]
MLSWPDAVTVARTALWRHRVESRQPGVDPDEGVDVDLIETVLAWLVQEAGDPRAHRCAVVMPLRLPAEATVYQRALLDAAVRSWERVMPHVHTLAAADALGEHLGAVPPDAEETAGVALQGADGRVACPVCGRDEGLVWLWDGQIVRGRCPAGDGEWTPRPYIGAPVWEQISAAVRASAG